MTSIPEPRPGEPIHVLSRLSPADRDELSLRVAREVFQMETRRRGASCEVRTPLWAGREGEWGPLRPYADSMAMGWSWLVLDWIWKHNDEYKFEPDGQDGAEGYRVHNIADEIDVFSVEAPVAICLAALALAKLLQHQHKGFRPGDVVRHYKGGFTYLILQMAVIEATQEEVFVYRSFADDRVWVRPVREFYGQVKQGSKLVPRFTLVNQGGDSL